MDGSVFKYVFYKNVIIKLVLRKGKGIGKVCENNLLHQLVYITISKLSFCQIQHFKPVAFNWECMLLTSFGSTMGEQAKVYKPL